MEVHSSYSHTRRPSHSRVRRRPLPADIRRNHFASHAVRGRRWGLLLGASVVVMVAVALSFLLSGCGYVGRNTSTTGPGSGSGSIVYPSSADALVLRVEVGGGFVPVEAVFTNMPMLSVYGDGRAISQGPIIAIYPGPALPNLQVAKISPAGMQKLLAAAREAGLLEHGVDYGQPAVADGATTTFTVAAEGEVFETSIYHLSPDNASDGVLTKDQVALRARVESFQSMLYDLEGRLGDEIGPSESFEWQALSILIMPADPDRDDPSGIEPRIVDWPLADLATLGEVHPQTQGRKALITGADLETLRPLVEQADTLTLWKSGGSTYSLFLRPLLPDEVE
ncbi:MAG: hypothetical protein ACYC33_06315 [Thermoleophilia bacterium]